MRVDGYSVTKLVHSSATSEVYEGTSEADGTEVVLKRYLVHGAEHGGSRAANEFHALRRIVSAGVPRAAELAASESGDVVVLERMPGTRLSRVIDAAPMAVSAWLDLALQLTDQLSCVHEARLLHNSLNPEQILLEVSSGRASMLGFGL